MLRDQYLMWPDLVERALSDWGAYRVSGDLRLTAVAGMGGSGIVGDYLKRLSDIHGGLPVAVYKTHTPPRYITSRDLVVVISYSGNTLEAIEFLSRVSGRTPHVVTLSSGGLLEEISRSKGYIHIGLPPGLTPRASLPSMLTEVLGLLDASNYTVIPKNIVEKAVEALREKLPGILAEAQRIANFISETSGLLIIAAHYPYDVLATRGKNEFCENSKIPVKVEVAPEWMHNDIVGWEKPPSGKYTVLALADVDDPIGVKLVSYMSEIYSRLGYPTYRVDLHGDSFLEKLLYGSLLLGLASVELAYVRGVDPLKTRSIEEYKARVREIFSV